MTISSKWTIQRGNRWTFNFWGSLYLSTKDKNIIKNMNDFKQGPLPNSLPKLQIKNNLTVRQQNCN